MVSIFVIPEIQALISILLIFLSDEEMVVMRPAVHYSTEEIFIQLIDLEDCHCLVPICTLLSLSHQTGPDYRVPPEYTSRWAEPTAGIGLLLLTTPTAALICTWILELILMFSVLAT